MSEKTLRDVYGHHHPDYLHAAANAIGTKKPVSMVNSLVRPQHHRLHHRKSLKILVGPGALTLGWNSSCSQIGRYEQSIYRQMYRHFGPLAGRGLS